MVKVVEGKPVHKTAARMSRATKLEAQKVKLKAEQTMRQLEEQIHENGRGFQHAQISTNGGGRPRGSKDQEYIDAIKTAYPPEKLLELIKIGIDLSVATGSWRGVEALLTFVGNYVLGKPKQRVEAGSSSALSELLAGMNTSKPLIDMDDTVGLTKESFSKPISDEGADGPAGGNGATESVVVENNRESDKDE